MFSLEISLLTRKLVSVSIKKEIDTTKIIFSFFDSSALCVKSINFSKIYQKIKINPDTYPYLEYRHLTGKPSAPKLGTKLPGCIYFDKI